MCNNLHKSMSNVFFYCISHSLTLNHLWAFLNFKNTSGSIVISQPITRWNWVHLITWLASFFWCWTKTDFQRDIQVQFPGSAEVSGDQKPGQWPIFQRQQSLEDSPLLLLDQLVLAHKQFLSNAQTTAATVNEINVLIKLSLVTQTRLWSAHLQFFSWFWSVLNIELSDLDTFHDLQTHLLFDIYLSIAFF